MQTMILGMHRSGTSALARLLNMMGMYFGPEGMGTGANQENPKGFWERKDVRQLNDSVLHAVECDWNRVSRFDVGALPEALVAGFRKQAAKVVLEMDAHRPWMMKEPRLSLLFPLWEQVLDHPICIHIIRHPLEVAASLKARNGIPIEAGLGLWERYVRAGVAASARHPRFMVSHSELMRDPVGVIGELHRQLGKRGMPLREPAPEEILGFVDPALHRQRFADLGQTGSGAEVQVEIFKKLTSTGLDADIGQSMSQGAKRALEHYERGLPPMKDPTQAKQMPAPVSAPDQIAERGAAINEAVVLGLRQEIEFLRKLVDKLSTHDRAREEALAAAYRDAGDATVAKQMLSGLRKQVEEAHAEGQELKQRLIESGMTAASLESSLRALAEEKAILEDERTATMAAFEASKGEVEAARSEVRLVRHDLAEWERKGGLLERHNVELLENIERLRKEGEERERRLALDVLAMRERADAMEAAALSAEQDAAARASRIKMLEEALERESTQVRIRFAEVEKLTRRLMCEEEKAQRLAEERLAVADELKETAARHAKDLAKLRQQLATAKESHNALLAKAKQDAARAASDLAARDTTIAGMAHELEKGNQKVSQMKQRIATITTSRSWRLTAPFRREKDPAPTGSADPELTRLRASDLFDPDWYLATYPDVAMGKMDPAEHYLRHGAAEGRNPGPRFDTAFYFDTYPDVRQARINPLLHYLEFGLSEGRRCLPDRAA